MALRAREESGNLLDRALNFTDLAVEAGEIQLIGLAPRRRDRMKDGRTRKVGNASGSLLLRRFLQRLVFLFREPKVNEPGSWTVDRH